MTTTAAPPATTLVDRLYAATEAIDRFNVDADKVIVHDEGITIVGVTQQSVDDLTPAFALRPDAPDSATFRGATLDGIPVVMQLSQR